MPSVVTILKALGSILEFCIICDLTFMVIQLSSSVWGRALGATITLLYRCLYPETSKSLLLRVLAISCVVTCPEIKTSSLNTVISIRQVGHFETLLLKSAEFAALLSL